MHVAERRDGALEPTRPLVLAGSIHHRRAGQQELQLSDIGMCSGKGIRYGLQGTERVVCKPHGARSFGRMSVRFGKSIAARNILNTLPQQGFYAHLRAPESYTGGFVPAQC